MERDRRELSAGDLRRSCRPEAIPFETTADAKRIEGVLGQERALDAFRFGIGIRHHGYNLFVVGPTGLGKQTFVRQALEKKAAEEKPASAWCYVYDFADPERPRLLELPPGMGIRLERDMAHAVAELRMALRAAFESEEYRTRKQHLLASFKQRQERALADVSARAKEHGVAVANTDSGIVVGPMRDGAAIDADAFHTLPKEQQDELQAEMERVGEELQGIFRKFHEWARDHREAGEALDREIASVVAGRIIGSVRRGYTDQSDVLDYLTQVERDVIEHADEFLEAASEGIEAAVRRALKREHSDGPSFLRYRINVLVDHRDAHGAPIVYEDHPTFGNLIGRIEHETQFGALLTNFTLIKAGAFHRAIGGYLILDARRVLQQPYAWEAVKRTIRSGEVRMESLGQMLGLVSTVSLEPTSVPLGRTKVVLVGERILYYLLAAADPDFFELFKVLVDLEDRIDRRTETEDLYANLVATLVEQQGLRRFERGAVARVIDHAARVAGDAEKLSLHMRSTVDLLREADFHAGEASRDRVTADDVQTAVDKQLYRGGRMRERLQEAVRRADVLIATSGTSIGQVNGLTVYLLGENSFGHPTRITARVRLGKGEVVDIEREVELGGPIHSKGVLILGGFLGARYATRFPLSVSATLVFEQTYAAVEGDSASLAELCALLSALAEVPSSQSLAITGSVNQHGRVQSIGGTNEKIEGFFDVCMQTGLTGEQGVLIPKSNVKNLMLRQDVVDAVEAGRFHLYAVEDVDDALELLMEKPAGVRDEAGKFPEGSINALVEARLVAFAESARAFAAKPSTS